MKYLMMIALFTAVAHSEECPPVEPPPTSDFTCTEVIGFSQTKGWYIDGNIEDHLNPDEWQLRWKSGTGVEKAGVLDPLNSVWLIDAVQPCAVNSDNPDRIVFNVSSSSRTITSEDVRDFVLNIANIAAARYSNLREVVVITVIGGPNGAICQVPEGMRGAGDDVGATVHQAKYASGIRLAAALRTAVPAHITVIEGNHPSVVSCSWYHDPKGHLQQKFNAEMAERMADLFLPR